MIFKVELATDNAAFHAYHESKECVPECADFLRGEVADILRRLRVKVTNTARPAEQDADNPFPLFDANGGRVGNAWFEEE